jgi:GAF domain-containing protein
VEIMPEFWAFLDRETLIPVAQEHVRAVLEVPFTAFYLASKDGKFELAGNEGGQPDVLSRIEPTAKQEAELHQKRVVACDPPGPAVGYVPIHVDRGRAAQLIGLMAIGNRSDGRGYSGDELKALADLGGKIGLALRAIELAEAKAGRDDGAHKVAGLGERILPTRAQT